MKKTFKTASPVEFKALQETKLKEMIRLEFGQSGKINLDKYVEMHTLPSTENLGLVRSIASYKGVPFAFIAVNYDGNTYACSIEKLSESEISTLSKTSENANEIIFGNRNLATLSQQAEINKLLATCPASVFVSLKEMLELRKLSLKVESK